MQHIFNLKYLAITLDRLPLTYILTKRPRNFATYIDPIRKLADTGCGNGAKEGEGGECAIAPLRQILTLLSPPFLPYILAMGEFVHNRGTPNQASGRIFSNKLKFI